MEFRTGDKASEFSPLFTALYLLLMESAQNLGSQEMQGNYREDQSPAEPEGGLQSALKPLFPSSQALGMPDLS